LDNLIKVSYETENPTVSARDLHEGLGIEKRFSAWFETNSQGFIEGEDFTSVLSGTVVNNGAKRDLQDYHLTVDMAKHICLMSRTEKGKQCRQYLIDLEKAWNTPEQVFARALKLADKEIDKLKADKSILIEDVQRMKPKEIFADAVSASHTSILVGEMAKLLRQNGVDIGEKRMFAWLRNNGYLIKGGRSDHNTPTQKSANMGLFETKETVIVDGKGISYVKPTPKVTTKGQQYFINKFLVDKQEVM
jgi:anti-repressor protein